MSEITFVIEFLNNNSGVLTLIFTAAVAVSTIFYAVLTAKLVSETRKMREVQTEPKIHITIESLDFFISLTRLNIKNIGLGPASDLQFRPRVVSGGESAENLLKEFTSSNFFKTGLRHLGPGQHVYSRYTDMREDFEGKADSVVAFKLDYKSVTGRQHHEEIIIDMSEMKDDYRLGKPHLYSIAQSLEKIQKDLGHIVSGFKRVRADVYSSEDRKREYEEWKKRYEKQTEETKNY